MAVLQGVVYFFVDHPSLIFIGFGLYCLCFYISLWFTKPKKGKNPFFGDSRQPIRPIIHDKVVRDKVLKQGFTQKRIPDKIDVIVIGSGISGMTTAALLAKAGKKVLVLEQHDQAGGCCHSFVERGFEFDSGIHYIGEMQHRTMGRTIFEQITDGQVQWAPLDQNFDTVAIGAPGNAKLYPLLSGKDAFKQSLVDLFPNETEAIDKYFDILKKARGLFVYFVALKILPVQLVNWIVKLKILNIFTSYGSYASMSTTQFLDSITDNEELKAVIAYCYGDYGTPPDRSSILMHAILINHFSYTSSYPVGGASEIAMQIIPVIERSLGRVLVRANVTDIIMERGKAVGVRVIKGDEPIEIRATTIVSAAGIPNTLKMLPQDKLHQTGLMELLDDKMIQSGVGAISLFVGLRGTNEELGLRASNMWAFTDANLNASFHSYMSEAPDMEKVKEVPLLFISFPSTKDPHWEVKYPGKSVCTIVTLANWEWFRNWESEKVMHRGQDYESLKERFSKQMWEQTLKFYPQLADKVEYMDLGSPVTNNYYIRSTKGEIYGLDHNKLRFRPDIASKLRPKVGIPGLYLTGQDIFVCGFSGGMFSGLITASAVLHRDLFKDGRKLHLEIKQKEKNIENARKIGSAKSKSD